MSTFGKRARDRRKEDDRDSPSRKNWRSRSPESGSSFSRKARDRDSPSRKNRRSCSPDRGSRSSERRDWSSRNENEEESCYREKDQGHEPQTRLKNRVFQGEEDTAIIVLEHPEKMVVRGKMNIRCLSGGVDILGYSLTPNEKTYPVYSPETNSHITIETTHGTQVEETLIDTISSLTDFDDSMKNDMKNCVDSCKSPVVLFCSELDSLGMLAKVQNYRDVFSYQKYKGDVHPDAVLFESNKVGLYRPSQNLKSLVVQKSYSRVSAWITERLQKSESPVVVVCGGANVGKSTLTRYIVNHTLNQVRSAYFLDCDLGQTEFTPPSCVSLSEVTAPLFGPPFTHQRKTVCSCFVGALSPGDDPEYYMSCLAHVYQKYTAKKKCLLIINTMGWIKGIGLQLLADTLRMVKPDLVVQLESYSKHKNMPELTSQFVATTPGWMDENKPPIDGGAKSHMLMAMDSPVSSSMDGQDRYRSQDHRSLSVLSYLSASVTNITKDTSWNSLTPYEVPWQSVALHIKHSAVPNSQILYALNASIVGLCKVSSDAIVDSDNEDYPKFVRGNPICECLGFGLVRGIDPVKKVFYIVTPLTAEECAEVNCLGRSAQDVPQQLHMEQKSPADVPYVGNPKDVIGASSVSRRRHQKRRRHTPTKN